VHAASGGCANVAAAEAATAHVPAATTAHVAAASAASALSVRRAGKGKRAGTDESRNE